MALVRKAFAGNVPWLDKWILAAGYIQPGRMTHRAVAKLWGVSRQAVAQWPATGCTQNRDKSFALPEVITWWNSKDEAETESGETRKRTKAQNKIDEERAKILELSRMEKEGSLLPKDAVRDSLSRLAASLRGAGEKLQRDFGADAQRTLDKVIDSWEREIERSFGSAT